MMDAAPSSLPLHDVQGGELSSAAAEGLALRIVVAVLLSVICAAALVALSGHNPLAAFAR